jgi:hypothetical protein
MTAAAVLQILYIGILLAGRPPKVDAATSAAENAPLEAQGDNGRGDDDVVFSASLRESTDELEMRISECVETVVVIATGPHC